jgi:hypothetical protein
MTELNGRVFDGRGGKAMRRQRGWQEEKRQIKE